MSRLVKGARVSFRGQVGTVEALDLTPGMVDVRYGSLVKRHRKDDVAPVSALSNPRNPRPPRPTVVLAGHAALGPAGGEEEKERRTKIPLTEKELQQKALLERGLTAHGAQLKMEGAAWMTLPDPARYVGGELCGNPIDGTLYAIAVNSKEERRPVVVTLGMWEAAVRSAGASKSLDTPEKKLNAWTKMASRPVVEWSDGTQDYFYNTQTKEALVGPRGQPLRPAEKKSDLYKRIQAAGLQKSRLGMHHLRDTVKRHGKGRSGGVIVPFTREEAEAARVVPVGFQGGQRIRARGEKGQVGKATRGPSEQYTAAEKAPFPPPRDAAYVEVPEGSGDYYYFLFDRKVSPVSEFFMNFFPPYDRHSGKKDSPFFSWHKLDRPFSKGELEGNTFSVRVDTPLLDSPGGDILEIIKKGTPVMYLRSERSWAHVRLGEYGLSGVVQREHLSLRNVSPFTQPPLCVTDADKARVLAAKQVDQYLWALKKGMNALGYSLGRGIEDSDYPEAYIDQAGQRFLKALAWTGSWLQSIIASLVRQPVSNYRSVPILEVVASLQHTIDLGLIPRLALGQGKDLVPLVSRNTKKRAFVFGLEEAGVSAGPPPPSLFLPMPFSTTTEGLNSVVGALSNRLRTVRTLKNVIVEKWRAANHPDPQGSARSLPDTRPLYRNIAEEKQHRNIQKEYSQPTTTEERRKDIEAESRLLNLSRSQDDKLVALYFLYNVMGGKAFEQQIDLARAHLKLIRDNAGSLPGESAAGVKLRLKSIKKAYAPSEKLKEEQRVLGSDLQTLEEIEAKHRGGINVKKQVLAFVLSLEHRLEAGDKEARANVVEIRTALNHDTTDLLKHHILKLRVRLKEIEAEKVGAELSRVKEVASLSTESKFLERGSFPFQGSQDTVVYYTFNPLLFEIARLSWNTRQSPWQFGTDGRLSVESSQKLRDVDTVGRYGYALKLFYEKALNREDFQSVIDSLAESVKSRDLRTWVLEKTAVLKQAASTASKEQINEWLSFMSRQAENQFRHAAVLEPGYGGQANIALEERGSNYGWVPKVMSGDAGLEVERFSEDPRLYLSDLRKGAVGSLVRQRQAVSLSVSAQPLRETRAGIVSTQPLEPLRASAGMFLRTPTIGEGEAVKTSFLPQSSVAALEDADNDSTQLKKLIQARTAELRKKLTP